MYRKVLLVAGIALAGLLAGSTTAAATFRMTLSSAGAISMASLGRLTFGTAPTVQCNVTLRGTLARGPIEMTSGESFGSVTEVRVANCTGGTWERPLNLNWPLRFISILQGIAPDEIEYIGYMIEGFSWNWSTYFSIVNCLYGFGIANGLPAALALNDTGRNTYTTALSQLIETAQVPFVRGSEACPSEGPWKGLLGLSAQQRITVS